MTTKVNGSFLFGMKKHHVSRVRERKEEGGGGVKGIYNPVS
jgi:hypothetical protein